MHKDSNKRMRERANDEVKAKKTEKKEKKKKKEKKSKKKSKKEGDSAVETQSPSASKVELQKSPSFKAKMVKQQVAYDAETTSMFIFTKDNCFRLWLKSIIENKYFDGFILNCIAFNSLLLALDVPNLYDPY